MQIIQTIREKGAVVIIAVIALSLIGFILMDAKQGSNGFATGGGTNIGAVNGNNISREEFEKMVKQQADMQAQQRGQQPDQEGMNQIRAQVWEQMVAIKAFESEAEKLGIKYTSEELTALFASEDQNNPLMQEQGMRDSVTGKLDLNRVKEVLRNFKNAKDGAQKEQINQNIDQQRLGSISNKYTGLLNAVAYTPKWITDKETKEAGTFASFSVAAIPYTMVSDSAVKVTDADIQTYINAHKGQFKQEAGRKLSYTTFSLLPSAEDSAIVKSGLEVLKPNFANATNLLKFVTESGTAYPFDSTYQSKARLASLLIDTLAKQPQGSVYGPYLDQNGMYTLAKVLASKTVPDSAKARHILISNQNKADDAAKKLADSVLALVKAGGNFTELAAKFSEDPGSKDKGGVYDYYPYGQMVPEFNEFTFTKPAGTVAVVKTSFGYHVIEAQGTKGTTTAYKVALIGKPIDPTAKTVNIANVEASKLSATKSVDKFNTYLKEKGLNKISIPGTIKENDFNAGGLRDARQLVRWAFDAKQGQVSEPMRIGDNYIVATIEKIYQEGTQDVETAKLLAENDVKNQLKAALISKKIGTPTSLETAAAAYNQQVGTLGADSSITLASSFLPSLGQETKLIGAAFNKEYQNKISPVIIGKTGVFYVKTNSVGTKTVVANPEAASQAARTTGQAFNKAWVDTIKKGVKITDNRKDFY
jgi:peptidyl-prolyl cis-trans isomerase D